MAPVAEAAAAAGGDTCCWPASDTAGHQRAASWVGASRRRPTDTGATVAVAAAAAAADAGADDADDIRGGMLWL